MHCDYKSHCDYYEIKIYIDFILHKLPNRLIDHLFCTKDRMLTMNHSLFDNVPSTIFVIKLLHDWMIDDFTPNP